MIPMFDCRRQHETLRRELDAAISGVLDKGWFVLGENVERFESGWADYCGTRYCVGVGSGMDALVLALKALGVGPGDEVLIPANATHAAVAARLCGAKVAPVDVDEDTALLDLERLEKAVTPRSKVVVPVHLYGRMVNMTALARVSRAHGLRIVEDACQAHGASLDGRKAGACSDVGCFSFYPSKNLGALGEAGAVITEDDELAESLRALRNYGKVDRYRHDFIGINGRLDEIQAAALRVKLPHLDRWNARRREIAQRYHSEFAGLKHLTCLDAAVGPENVYHLFVVRCGRRDALRTFLAERSVASQIHYPIPVHLQGAFAEFKLGRGSFPRAETLADEVLSIPLFPELTAEEIDSVVDAVRAFEIA